MLRFKRAARRRTLQARSEVLETRLVLSTFYVNGDTGDDANTGGLSDPFASLQRGVDAAALSPGDDVLDVKTASAAYQGAFIEDTSGALTIAGDGDAVSAAYLRVVMHHDLTVTGLNFEGQAIRATTPTSAEAPNLTVSDVTAFSWNGIDVSTPGHVSVSDSTLFGPLGFEPNTGGIRASSFASLVVDNVVSTGNVSAGVLASFGGSVDISNSTFSQGVKLRGVGDVEFSNSTVAADDGFATTENQFRDVNSLSVSNVTSNSALSTFSVASLTPDVTIVDSSFGSDVWFQPAIGISGAGDILLRGSTASGGNLDGVSIYNVQSVTIEDHVSRDNRRDGVTIGLVSGDVVISDFEVSANGSDGIRADDVSGSTTLADGNADGNRDLGFYLTDSGDLDVSGSTSFIGNRSNGIAAIRVGVVDISGTTVQESGPYGASGQNGLYVFVAESVSVSDSTISDNTFDGLGTYGVTGPISISNVTAERNAYAGFRSWSSAEVIVDGGSFSENDSRGIQLENALSVSISNSTVANNGTLAAQYFGQTGGAGIGIATQATGIASITGSAVYGNVGAVDGAGVWTQSSGVVNIANSTIAENESAFSGGGLVSFSAIETTLTNLTIANNTAALEGGGLTSAGTVNVGNTIISGNTSTFGNDVVGNVNSLGNNLISDPSESSGFGSSDQLGVDPLLQPLADNGGATFTMALGENSPALDAGDDALAPNTDQRGIARPQGGQSDIGAFEAQVIEADVIFGTSKLNLNNAVDNRGKFRAGTFVVSILTNSSLDASMVDVSTVVWAGASVSSYSLVDVDRDGDLDLRMEFLLRDTDLLERFRDAADANGSKSKQQYDIQIPLAAKTYGGTSVLGESTLTVFMTGKKLRDFLDGI